MDEAKKAWEYCKAIVSEYPGAALIAVVLGPLLVWIF